MGGLVSCELPDRIHDGYGLNESLITSALQAGTDTILTCDNGIAAAAEIAFAKRNAEQVNNPPSPTGLPASGN